MSAEDVQVIRDFYAAFARGDVAAALAGLDENIEWTSPASLPTGGTRRGHAALAAHAGEVVKQYQELHIEPVEFIDGGGTIVVLTRSRATAAGGSYDQTAVHLWRMHDGKAVSFTEFLDTAVVLQALGQEIASS